MKIYADAVVFLMLLLKRLMHVPVCVCVSAADGL